MTDTEYVTEAQAREWGATHYGYDEETDLYVLLAVSASTEPCEAEDGESPCGGTHWQPIAQEGGPGPECDAHTMLTDVRPIDGPVRMWG